MDELNFVERIGLEVLRRRIDRKEPHIHKWTPAELAEIERTERRTKIVAALAGAISGAALGIIEIWLGEAGLNLTGATPWREQLPHWAIYVILTIVISGLEVLCLYAYALGAVARIGSIAGLSLPAREVEQLVARGLARAALEMPNPRQPIHGIDPYARVPRWKLVAYAVLYRVKVGATSFILRVVLRRVLARTAFRVLIPLVAIPVFAVWNVLIARWVMGEVRLRVAGPLIVHQLGERIRAARALLDQRSRQIILEAIAEVIQSGEDAHPNYALLLERLFEELAFQPESVKTGWHSTRNKLAELSPQVQDLLLTILTVTAVLNSRMRKAQRELLAEAFNLCGRPFRHDAVLRLRQEFITGQGLSDEQLCRLIG